MTSLAPPPPASATPPPGEPATQPPPRLSSGGRTAARVTLIAAAAVLVVGSVVSLSVLAWGISGFRVVTDSAALPTAMRSLVVDTGSVPVAVRIVSDREAREPRVDLRMVNSTRAEPNPLQLSADRADARVTLTGEPTPFLQWSRAGEITVVLPPDVARRLTLTTEQRTGVVIAEADLEELIAHTDDGAVVLSGSARRVDIQNVNGEVVTREPVSVAESFSATTVTGDINVEFGPTAPRTVEASSQDGDVLIALPGRGPYVVNTDNAGSYGATVVRVPRTANREQAAAVITARSQHGDVIVDDLR